VLFARSRTRQARVRLRQEQWQGSGGKGHGALVGSGKSRRSARAPARRTHELRIIGGSWRGRKLRVAALPALRPTPDRVRETLFNWLRERVRGARCLDLFAGSGALGLEALSRGAAHVTFIEQEEAAVRELRARLTEWQAQGGEAERADALAFLAGTARPFDLAFIDPPFASALIARSCALLEERGWLSPGALVYVESPAAAGAPDVPASWQMLRSKRAGEVGYHLFAHARAEGARPA
jgi:16S rRNA (guanine966-N2)-methyltransferase